MAIICLPFALAGYAAQLTATLQSGDKFTPFYGADAFKEAYAAAVDGDIITLSTGVFNTVDIEKSITVVGSYAFHDDDAKATKMEKITVSADNVTLEGVNITDALTIYGADNLSISRCQIHRFIADEKDDHKFNDNTVVTNCLINLCSAIKFSKNAVFRNSCINYFTTCNTPDNIALIENCNVATVSYYLYSINDYGYSISYEIPYAIFRNCILGLYGSTEGGTPKFSPTAPSEFHDNIVYQSYKSINCEWTIDFTKVQADGNILLQEFDIADTSKVKVHSSLEPIEHDGKKYGPINHKAYPAIPEITSATIDTQTDAEGKLHVKITAVAHD